jgi:hypothetical protein
VLAGAERPSRRVTGTARPAIRFLSPLGVGERTPMSRDDLPRTRRTSDPRGGGAQRHRVAPGHVGHVLGVWTEPQRVPVGAGERDRWSGELTDGVGAGWSPQAMGRPCHSRSARISLRRCAFVWMWARTSVTARSRSPERMADRIALCSANTTPGFGGDRAFPEAVAGGEGAGQDPFGQAVGHLLRGGRRRGTRPPCPVPRTRVYPRPRRYRFNRGVHPGRAATPRTCRGLVSRGPGHRRLTPGEADVRR